MEAMPTTRAEREAYAEAGYLVRERVFSASELEGLIADLEDACERVREEGARLSADFRSGGGNAAPHLPELGVQAIWESDLEVVKLIEPVMHFSERLQALWEHPVLVELARIAVGAGEVGPATDKFNTKRRRSGSRFPWHQDYLYWYPFLRQQARDLCTVMIFLDDATEANGAMVVVPGTQTGPLLRRRDAEVLIQRLEIDESRLDTSRETVVEVGAGGVLVFGSLLLHRSGPNTTDADRRALLLTYQPAGRPRIDSEAYKAAIDAERWFDELP